MAGSDASNNEQWICASILGSGAFGIVELWKNITTMEKIAVKKCQIDIDKLTPKQKERWIHEVKIMNQLNHPNIVGTRKISNEIIKNDNELPVLCMEYCNKGDLRNVLNECENFCGVQEHDALRIMYDISSAVEYIHSHKITHRDLKPSNIVMQQTNNRIVYKLIDLGYAKELGDVSISASIVGTLNYVAPELLWKDTYSCSVDYWSLGILFYEVITGTRPFLPNMQLNKIWMNHIQGKQYEHISAREINGQVHFFENIEDPTHLPDCLKLKLAQWFKVVFQWDPRQRGKLKDGQLVVFTMLKSIFDKKIVRTFIVSHFKFKSYAVNSYITVGELKLIIQEKEGIINNEQILTDSIGKILNDPESLTAQVLRGDIIFVFHREILCTESIPKSKLSYPIEEMIRQPHSECDYYTLRRYYGATIFFMKNELKLYQFYILALSVIIDLSDATLKSLSTSIRQLTSDKECLISELESTLKLVHNCPVNKYTQDYEILKQKINKFLDGIKQMMEKFDALIQNNEELKCFSDINWMDQISTPYDKALILLNEWNKENHNRRNKPHAMVKLIFEFLAAKNKQLSNPQLVGIQQNISQFQQKLNQSEKVITSFVELMKFYRRDIGNLHETIVKECESIERAAQLNKGNEDTIINTTRSIENLNSPTSIPAAGDSMIHESIVICNMLGGLIIEMDAWKQKFSALLNFDE